MPTQTVFLKTTNLPEVILVTIALSVSMHLRKHENFLKNETQKCYFGGFLSGGFLLGVFVRGLCLGVLSRGFVLEPQKTPRHKPPDKNPLDKNPKPKAPRQKSPRTNFVNDKTFLP